jgi:6-pyruvoyltetrahydropterin/6-carboxytetrahydropterin synthase
MTDARPNGAAADAHAGTGAGLCDASCAFTVAASRRLTGVPSDHPCARLHGHTFQIRVTVRGPIHPTTGFVQDFAELQAAWAPLHEQLDHHYLNDVPGLENPTSERLAQWIWRALKPALPALASITIGETGDSTVTYRG